MDKSKIIKIRGENKHLAKLIIGGITLLVIIYIVINFLIAVGHPFDVSQEQDKRAALGSLGDYFGGLLNPLFAFLSFMGVLWTLKMSREELLETRKVLNEQLKTQKIQQFENNFYQLFSQLNKLQDEVVGNKHTKINSILGCEIYNKLTLKGAKEELIKHREISRYFILLYQVLKLIDVEVLKFPSSYSTDSSEWEDEKLIQKKFYTNLIRSQQDNKMLQLLFINCFDDGFSDFKKYLKEASFFEHMNFQNNADDSYNYLVLSALPYYVVKKEDLQKKKDIPYFDEGLGLAKSEYFLVSRIYEVKNKNYFDFEFVQYLYRDFLVFRAKDHVSMSSGENIIDAIYFSTPYFIELRLRNDQIQNINLSVKEFGFYGQLVNIVCSNDEKMILDLSSQQIKLESINAGKKFEFDGWYTFDEMGAYLFLDIGIVN